MRDECMNVMMCILYMLTKQAKQIDKQNGDDQTTPIQPDTQPIKMETSLERKQNH